jgi:hypothetical protein
LSAVLLLAISCSGEKKKVENLVAVYNDVLVDALLRPNPKLMQNFTTKRENVRISSYIALLAKDNKSLRETLWSLISGM